MPKHLLPLEHRLQEVETGCLAACAQMVLAYLGLARSQTELNRLFELTAAGVPLSRLTRLTQSGLQVTIRRNGQLADLMTSVDQGTPPIAFLRTGPLDYWQIDTQYALVVSGYEENRLYLHDPAFPDGPQQIPSETFMLAWDEFDNTFALMMR